MADIKISMMLQDSGNSVGKATSKTKALNEQLERTKKLASTAFASSKAAPSMAAQGFDGEMEGFSRSRGTIGTGAAGRDFSNQAQGLGGLVRVYATFAANIFAATAAFNALKTAADTTTMVKGLDQLSASSGTALGSLSREFVRATGDAISLREGMQSVAKASAAGLSNKQILEIAKFAKTASQALGVDMTDAVNRLSRGIVKLEPELLDELGLFTKTGAASEKYAKSVGKSASSLTDFEKRQAFANAVLEEAREKFGAIQLDANPYQKLEASVRNLATAGLELVNKVLGPLINILAQSPTALAAVIGLIATSLVKQAIPALTQWRSELSDGLERASASAAQNLEYFRNYQQDIAKAASNNISKAVKDQVNTARTSWEKLGQETRQGVLRNNKELRRLLSTELDNTGKQQLEKLDKLRQQYQRAAGAFYQDPARQQGAQARFTEFQKAESEIRKAILAKDEYNRALQAATPTNLTLQGKLLERIATNAENAEKKMRILTNAADNAAFSGPISAMRNMSTSIKQLPESVDRVSRGMIALRGTVTIAAVAVGTLTAAFGNLLGFVGIITGVYGILSLVFSKNSEQVREFNAAIDKNAQAVQTAENVVKKYGETVSLQSTVAKANIFTTLSDGAEDLANKLEELDKKAGWFDKLEDSVKIAFGGGAKSNFATEIALMWEKQLKLIPQGPLKDAVETQLMQITGASRTGFQELRDAIGGQTNELVIDVVRKGQKAFEAQRLAQEELKATAMGVQEALKETKDANQDLAKSFQNTDPISKYGISLVNSAIKLNNSFKDIQTTIISVDELLKDPKILATIGPDVFGNLLDASKLLPEVNTALNKYKDEVFQAQKRLTRISSLNIAEVASRTNQDIEVVRQAYEEEKQKLKKDISTFNVNIQVKTAELEKIRQTVKEVAIRSLDEGYRLINRAVEIATKQASISIQKGLLQGVSGIGVAKETARLNIEEINLQKQQIDISQKLNETMIMSNIIAEKRLAFDSREKLKEVQEKSRGMTPEESKNIERKIAEQDARFKRLTEISTGKFAIQPGQIQEPDVEALKLQLIQSRTSARTAKVGLNAQIVNEENQAILKTAQELRAEEAKRLEVQKTGLGLNQQLLELKTQSFEFLTNEQQVEKENIQLQALRNTQESKRQQISSEIEDLFNREALARKQDQFSVANTLFNIRTQKERYLEELTSQELIETSILKIQQQQARVAQEYSIAIREMEKSEDARTLKFDTEKELLELQKQELDILKTLGTISEETYNTSVKAIEEEIRAREFNNKILLIEFDRRKKLEDILKRERTAKTTGPLSLAEENVFEIERKQVEDSTAQKVESATRVYNATTRLRSLNDSLTDDQKKLSDIYKDTFSKMSDVIVDFVKTGKLNFKSLIDDMLAQILRMYANKMFSKMFTDLLPFLPGMGGGSGFGTGSKYGNRDYGEFLAKGGVFDDGAKKYYQGGVFELGMPKFAKGGTFTNTIVDQPTNFRFAKGIGLMGEAGPEAIMPLKRDSQGNLGVRSNSSNTNVEVVVNNYSKDSARTEETTDSQGNRRIEVIIGDMTATEVSRNGSGTQKAMRGTFGLQPQLIRR